ncbi:MAG: sensor histidine kinase [Paludibacteraceae bacterium]|nr:sensor histidine kinase [Prevotella sp.]MBQ8705940.1 sensor histidine kinase [Paludibacteraceae bacterium]MBQ8715186.1 sensor histidine kinase [Prevotella sp.]
MNKKVSILLLSMTLGCVTISAQESQKSELQKNAEAAQTIPAARYNYIRAYEDYVSKGQMQQGIECGAKAASLYSKDGLHKEAFELLRNIDQVINNNKQKTGGNDAGLHYLVTKERMQMYMKFRKPDSAKEQLNVMEALANASNDEKVKNDLLYSKAIYYYSFGLNAQGDAVFKEMANKLTASKEYDKVDEVYKQLIANGRKSNNASMVAQSYSNYLAWKDSTNALKHADEIAALKKQIADNEASIEEKDSSLTTRWVIIVALLILAGALAAALVIGAIILLRFILQTRKQKKIINLEKDNNALKAKFISNISAQLDPTLQKLDSSKPEVKSLMEFSQHIQTLSELENSTDEIVLEETQIPPFCEGLMDQIRDKVKRDVTLKVNAPKMTIDMNKEYVSHILLHLLTNAAIYTPEGGTIWLEYKKRSAHTHQFLVSDTGCGIPEEKREDIFKPFLEIRDLTKGDGLGLPICKQMALKMNGDLEIDPEFTKGTRFVLDLHS